MSFNFPTERLNPMPFVNEDASGEEAELMRAAEMVNAPTANTITDTYTSEMCLDRETWHKALSYGFAYAVDVYIDEILEVKKNSSGESFDIKTTVSPSFVDGPIEKFVSVHTLSSKLLNRTLARGLKTIIGPNVDEVYIHNIPSNGYGGELRITITFRVGDEV